MKAQPVRLLDVFVLGPAMIWIAFRSGSRLTQVERAFLGATGVATIGYNLANYLEISSKGGCACQDQE